jgi:hypothetical protein
MNINSTTVPVSSHRVRFKSYDSLDYNPMPPRQTKPDSFIEKRDRILKTKWHKALVILLTAIPALGISGFAIDTFLNQSAKTTHPTAAIKAQ